MREVVITGVGPVTPLGGTFDEVAAALLAGHCAIALDAPAPDGRLRASVRVTDDLEAGLPLATVRTCDRTTLLALCAARRAMADAGLAAGDFDSARAGTYLGCGIGATHAHHAAHSSLLERNAMGAMALLRVLPNAPASFVAMHHGLRAECVTFASGSAAAAQALGSALRAVQRGEVDVALAGGVEAPLAEASFWMFERFGLTAPVDAQAPQRACRPFDRDRQGIVLGEGGAMFVLEPLEAARARGATLYARLAGYGASSDAFDIAASGVVGQVQAMQAALADARLQSGDVQYVRAVGNGTRQGDSAETRALKEVFGRRASAVPVSGSKGAHGHLLGASAALELVTALVPLRHGMLPPTLHRDNPDPECDLDVVPHVARAAAVDTVLANTSSLGGHNASLVLQRVAP